MCKEHFKSTINTCFYTNKVKLDIFFHVTSDIISGYTNAVQQWLKNTSLRMTNNQNSVTLSIFFNTILHQFSNSRKVYFPLAPQICIDLRANIHLCPSRGGPEFTVNKVGVGGFRPPLSSLQHICKGNIPSGLCPPSRASRARPSQS